MSLIFIRSQIKMKNQTSLVLFCILTQVMLIYMFREPTKTQWTIPMSYVNTLKINFSGVVNTKMINTLPAPDLKLYMKYELLCFSLQVEH